MYVKYFKLKKSWVEILDLEKNIKEEKVYKICNKKLDSLRGKISSYEIKISEYKESLNSENLGILKKELRKNKLSGYFVINKLENEDAILVVRGSIYSIDTSVIEVYRLKEWLKTYRFSKEIKNNILIKKYKNISEVISYDSLSRYGIQKGLKTCGIVNSNNKIYIKYDGFSYDSVWENISDRNIILGSRFRLPKHKLIKMKDHPSNPSNPSLGCSNEDKSKLNMRVYYGKPIINMYSNDLLSTIIDNKNEISDWGYNSNNKVYNKDIVDIFKKVSWKYSIYNRDIVGSYNIESLNPKNISELKLSLLEFSYSGPWNIYRRKYSVENKYKWGKKGKRKLFWKKKSHYFSNIRGLDRKIIGSRECIDNIILSEWKKKRYKSIYLNELKKRLLNTNEIGRYYENGEIKEVELRRILKKDKEKKPRWKNLFHLYKRWWIPIKDPLISLDCVIDLGIFISNKIIEYKITGKITKCKYWRELCKWEFSSVGRNINLSKIVYVIRKILNISYNIVGILELENILLRLLIGGELSNISRKSILYNIIHKIINKEETLNRYNVYDNKKYKIELELNIYLKEKIVSSSNKNIIFKRRDIREYKNILTGNSLDSEIFISSRLEYLRKYYNISCNYKLLESIISNYKNNKLIRLPNHKPRIYPVRRNQWIRYPWIFNGKLSLLRKTLLKIILENPSDLKLFNLIIDLIINKSELRINERDRLISYLFSKTPYVLWKERIDVIKDKESIKEIKKWYS